MEKSKDHKCFLGKWEYFIVSGELYRAPVDRPIVNGYRLGARWQGPEWLADDIIREMQQALAELD